MLLIISQSKRIAKNISETFHYMSILSYGATPTEGLSEISELYRAVVIYEPNAFPDIGDYVRRIRRYKSDVPIFAIVNDGEENAYTDVFDKTFVKPVFSPAIASRIINYATKNEIARIGDYRLAGIKASADEVGITYFSKRLDFTKTEAMILRYLIRSYPLPQSSADILKYAFRQSRAPEVASIRTHISFMNKKFGELTERKLIISQPGRGYVILTPEIQFNIL